MPMPTRTGGYTFSFLDSFMVYNDSFYVNHFTGVSTVPAAYTAVNCTLSMDTGEIKTSVNSNTQKKIRLSLVGGQHAYNCYTTMIKGDTAYKLPTGATMSRRILVRSKATSTGAYTDTLYYSVKAGASLPAWGQPIGFSFTNNSGNNYIDIDYVVNFSSGISSAKRYFRIDDVAITYDHYQTYTHTMSDSTRYRYGFNGQEKDNEVYGEGNSYTAEFWEYDPRLGRRWNCDPVSNPRRPATAARTSACVNGA